MGTLINISSPQQQLRQNRSLLLLVGGVSTVAGLFLWSAPPFIWSNPKDKVSVCLRYLALFGSLGCGITAVVAGKELERINPLIKAIETAERQDFLSQLAASQYMQEQQWQREAMTALQPTVRSHNEISSNSPNDAVTRDNEISNEVITDSVTAERPSERASEMEDYKPIYSSIIALKEQGMSDSDIIKDVLKMGGANYQAGKQMLETLLQLGQSENW